MISITERRARFGAASRHHTEITPNGKAPAPRPSARRSFHQRRGPTRLREKLVKIGAKVVTHVRYVIFQMAEVAAGKRLFRAILERIRRLRLPEMVPG